MSMKKARLAAGFFLRISLTLHNAGQHQNNDENDRYAKQPQQDRHGCSSVFRVWRNNAQAKDGFRRSAALTSPAAAAAAAFARVRA